MDKLNPMDEIERLYRDVLLEHYRRPRHFGKLAKPTHSATNANPLCGDAIRVDMAIRNGRIEDIAFSGNVCAICKASASLMTEHLLDKTVDDAIEIAEITERMIETGSKPDRVYLKPLLFLAEIAQFSARIPCAQLGWQTVRRALSSPEGR